MRRALLSLTIALGVGACHQSDFERAQPPPTVPDGPGTTAWGEEDVSCEVDGECHDGETCSGGVCQMKRCTETAYSSAAPLGRRHTFVRDRELVVSDGAAYDGGYWIAGYDPQGTAMVYAEDGGGDWQFVDAPIVDMAGGNLLDSAPDALVIALEGDPTVTINGAEGSQRFDLDFVPRALATGDVDRDGRDELIALGEAGDVEICDLVDGVCELSRFDVPVTGIDAAVGDIDGDHFAEPIFLIEVDGEQQLLAWNLDSETSGQPTQGGGVPSITLTAIAAGDVDGDGADEIIGLEDGGWFDYVDDGLYVFKIVGEDLSELGETDTGGEAVDVTLTDLDDDRRDEVVVLRGDASVAVLRGAEPGRLAPSYETPVGTNASPKRIAALDFDGDSTIGELIDGPMLVAGEIVPTVVLYMPPFYRRRSASPPWLWMGNSRNMGKSLSDTVSLSVGTILGVEAEFPEVLSVEVTGQLATEMAATTTNSVTKLVGNQYYLEVDPALYGEDYAAVILSCGCFHQYVYRMVEPSGRTGGDGRQFTVLLPVGGQSTMWSSKRYNAMARAVGGLPIITVPHRVGDPESYPTTAERADGSPIPADDLVLSMPPTVRVSDIGDVGWNMRIEDETVNEVAQTTSLDVEGTVTIGGFKVGKSVGLGWGQGYAVSVGHETEFIGGVPPIADDATTPEDEYETYAYTFTPLLYREHYVDGAGNDAGYYVLNYAVNY